MKFLELSKERFSVRKFSDKKVEKEKLDLILEAGRTAPTACNYQPQRILVLNDEKDLSKISLCTPFQFHQQLALLVCYDKTVSWKRKYDEKDEGEIDASIVATHMMLQASELGIGSTWVGHFDPEKIKKAYCIPEHIIPAAILLMGYPAEDAVPNKLHYERLDIEQTVFYGSFDDTEKEQEL
ncbi:nitroreductase family protein [Clostridium boliviensis]|uniref:Nitroreductase family protein n=1 Tax=Clostridium boliviensis TaxID=318465 RepID=A0ABU4GPK0_9CLOT|nr:nitroreductase family protein [Clostridium boliviensis]MDW2798838.1 nitroreductase family protein [Clostridium boliviensis]